MIMLSENFIAIFLLRSESLFAGGTGDCGQECPRSVGVAAFRLAAADEMDYFYFVGFGDRGFGPIFAADDVVVEFDRDLLAGKLKVFEKFFDVYVFGNRALFAVHNDLHKVIILFYGGHLKPDRYRSVVLTG